MSEAISGAVADMTHPAGGSGTGRAIGNAGPSDTEIREELGHILQSAEFDASERNRRFLSYVVEETLAGRADRIKAYCIATVVFGRAVAFDPQADPVVRMEAQRLRRSLERFYLKEGRPLQILLPKGGYVPEFRVAIRPTAPRSGHPTSGPARFGHVPSIFVARFEVEADDTGCDLGGTGFSYQLMIVLSRHSRWNVLCAGPGQKTDTPADVDGDRSGKPDFILMGSRAVSSGKMHVKVILLDTQTGLVAWGRSFERAILPESLFETRDDIANGIARALLRSDAIHKP